MDSSLTDWNTQLEVELPMPNQRKSMGLDNDLAELLWQNGEVVMHSQTHRKPSYDPFDESFEKEFCSNFLPKIPAKNFFTPDVFPSSQEFGPNSFPPPRFEITDLALQPRNMGQGDLHELSVITMGSSHCGSNQVACNLEEKYGRKITEKETLEQAITSSSGGSGSTFWKTSNQSNGTNMHKRKNRDGEESECQSDATELESGSGNKSPQKFGTTRRSRVAEVHNLSERKRRDRINEKMRALQELIPHSNKSDKASMLDEAIEYMKSLQSQIQFMWMGSGMAPLVHPIMQPYMSRIGLGMAQSTVPPIHNLMRLSRLPLVNQSMAMSPSPNQATIGQRPVLSPINYQNQIQSHGLPEQYANYMGLYSMQNTSQPMNVFGFGSHSAQQNRVLAPPANRHGNGNGSIG